MKKFASLLVALALVLTSVSALAAVVPSKTSGDIAIIVPLTDGVWMKPVPYDFKAEAEVRRLQNAFISGKSLEKVFNIYVATEIAGAKDLLDVIAVKCGGETEEETVQFAVFGSNAYAGQVLCVMGVYNAALKLYEYVVLPTECNADGSATITLNYAEEFVPAAKAESVVLAFVKL